MKKNKYTMKKIMEFKEYLNNNFIKWFGNSKIVDEKGNPKICFHGTNNNFNEFRIDSGHVHDSGFYGKGFYFMPFDNKYSKGEAETYGNIIMEVYLKIENPFYFDKLLEFENKSINLMFYSPLVFLYNIALTFPNISNKIKISKTIWNKDESTSGEVINIPISVLPDLINKYKNDLIIIDDEDQNGNKIKTGYLKSKSVKHNDINVDGEKYEWLEKENLGDFQANLNEKEIRFGLIASAIELYDDISTSYFPEGYMTRNPEISKAIVDAGYDGIITDNEIVAFKPNQIKSANKNNGNFDLNKNNIIEKKIK
jgi:hypothetical protein